MSSPFLLASHEPHVGSLFLADDGSAPVGYKTFVDGRGRWQEVGNGEPRTPSTLDTLQINHVDSSKHSGARCLPPSPARSLLFINDTIPKKLTHSLHADLFAETGYPPTGGQAGSNASSLVGFCSLFSSRPHPPSFAYLLRMLSSLLALTSATLLVKEVSAYVFLPIWIRIDPRAFG